MEYVIQTQNLCKRYRKKYAVNNVSLGVKRGEIYGLIGRNGAGKTTLMKMLLGLCTPTDGQISLFGEAGGNKARQRIGSLIEAPGLYKNCTAKENMLRFATLYGVEHSAVTPLLELVGLADTGKKKAGEFSLGMKQRLGVAIALLGNPEILVLDEPVNGLDPAGIKQIRDLLVELNGKGVTVLISSHLLDELSKIVTVYGILADGRLVEEITAEELNYRCRGFIKLVCSSPDAACALLKEKFEGIEAEVKTDGLYLTSHVEQIGEINALLVQSGITVTEFTQNKGGVEEYFIERMGR